MTTAELRNQTHGFGRQTGVASGSDLVARCLEPAYPKMVSIKPEYAAIVETRMREIAELSGIATADQGCQGNIAVSFTTDGPGLMQQIARKSPSRLAELPPHMRDR